MRGLRTSGVAAASLLMAAATLSTGCGSGDRYAPDLAKAEVVATIDGPVVLGVVDDDVFVGERGTGRVRSASGSGVADAKTTEMLEGKLRAGAAALDRDGLVIAADGRIARKNGKELSKGWVGPVALAVDGRNRLWAVDGGRDGKPARVARGRTTDVAKRNRFATRLPKGANPVGAAADDTEVYVCDAATQSVLRFHVGLDDVARRRGALDGVKCRYDIAVTADGAIVTATETQILRYPRR